MYIYIYLYIYIYIESLFVMMLFGGTSGCGKSTLASLTASRLGITTVLSTDFVRHMLRRELSHEHSPLLYASTYNAGEALPVEGTQSDERDLEIDPFRSKRDLLTT